MHNPDLARLGGIQAVNARPSLVLIGGKVHHRNSTEPTRIVFREGQLSIGCTDIEVDAARHILQEYDKWLGKREHVLQ